METNNIFISDFDENIYRQNINININNLRQHYLKYGIYEGHKVHEIDRDYFVNFFLNNSNNNNDNILEIGPYHSPLLDHSKPNIYSVDLLTKEELIDHAIKDNNIDKKKINNIPETNFILSSKNDYCVSKCIKYLKFNYEYIFLLLTILYNYIYNLFFK